MSAPFDSLPSEVQDALRRGRHEDAVHLLRKATGVALKSAQARIAYVVAQGIPGAQASPHLDNSSSDHGFPPVQGPPDLAKLPHLLLDVIRAAARKRTEAAQGFEPSIHPADSSLSPGEQPGGHFGGLFILVLVALAVVAAFFWFKPFA